MNGPANRHVPKADAQWFIVPAGSRSSSCRGPNCHVLIHWMKHPRTGKPHPIDCTVEGGLQPSVHAGEALPSLFGDQIPAQDGRGVSHFDTCVDARRFRDGLMRDGFPVDDDG